MLRSHARDGLVDGRVDLLLGIASFLRLGADRGEARLELRQPRRAARLRGGAQLDDAQLSPSTVSWRRLSSVIASARRKSAGMVSWPLRSRRTVRVRRFLSAIGFLLGAGNYT